MPLSPTEVFHRVVQGVSDCRVAELPALYAEDTQVVHPMDPARGPALRTREQLAEHFAAGVAMRERTGTRFHPCDITVHQTADPEVIVAEFRYRGTANHGAVEFELPCVFIMRVRDGQIVESRDYADHAEFARVRGELEALLATLRAR